MNTTKTIVITLPKPMCFGQNRTANVLSASQRQLAPLVTAADFIRMIKDEPFEEVIEVHEDKLVDSPRKRQKLDHLSFEEKLMRRKLKNRVAAQTARDRKKQKMDELEDHVEKLNRHINQLVATNNSLKEGNKKLTEENVLFKEKISKCTCNSSNNRTIITSTNTLNTDCTRVRNPVSAVTVRSAEGGYSRGSTLVSNSKHNLLPVASTSITNNFNKNTCIQKPEYFENKYPQPILIETTTNKSATLCEVVGTTTGIVESSQNIKDETCNIKEETCNSQGLTITSAEEKMISELTLALHETTYSKLKTEGTGTSPVIPNILELLNFDDCLNQNLEDSLVTSDKSSTGALSSSITKEQILDYLQDIDEASSPNSDCTSSPTHGSESGYESVFSPPAYSPDYSSFTELFPNLF